MGPLPSGSAEKTTATSREEILEKLRERIVGFAASRLQRDAAEDLAQEVLILLHQKYGHLDLLEDLLLAHSSRKRRIKTPDGLTQLCVAMGIAR